MHLLAHARSVKRSRITRNRIFHRACEISGLIFLKVVTIDVSAEGWIWRFAIGRKSACEDA
jgi:hypothetical protein